MKIDKKSRDCFLKEEFIVDIGAVKYLPSIDGGIWLGIQLANSVISLSGNKTSLFPNSHLTFYGFADYYMIRKDNED